MKFKEKCGNRYPWETWLSRLPLTLTRGIDFPREVLPSSIGVMLRVKVLERGLRRTIKVDDRTVTVTRQKSNPRGRRRGQTYPPPIKYDGDDQ